MRSSIQIFCAICALSTSCLFAADRIDPKTVWFGIEPRLRSKGDVVFDMSEYFGESNGLLGLGLFKGWCIVEGRVLQARSGDGLLLSLEGMSCDGDAGDGRMPKLPESLGTIFIKNPPMVADDDRVRLAVFEDGFHEYRAVSGGLKRVRAYNCGVEAARDAKAAFLKRREHERRIAAERRASEAQAMLDRKAKEDQQRLEAKQREIERTKSRLERQRLELEERIIAHLRARVESGSADACFDLGMRYLNGDGVPKDRAEALRLMGVGAGRGSKEATAWLEEHNVTVPK